MRDVSPNEIKGLFHHLVRAVGGIQAAGAYLNISHQRISQLQTTANNDMPTIMQIVTLEQAAGRPIVTGVLAEAATGEARSCVQRAAVAAVEQGAKALRLVHDMDADRVRDTSEIKAVQAAALSNVDAAKTLADAASSLTPGRVG